MTQFVNNTPYYNSQYDLLDFSYYPIIFSETHAFSVHIFSKKERNSPSMRHLSLKPIYCNRNILNCFQF